MIGRINQIALLVVFSFLVFHIAAYSQALPSDSETFDKTIGIQYPMIEGWDRGVISYFPVTDMGYSIGYQSGDNAVTFYVYTDGLTKISNDLSDEVVKARMTKATNDILKVADLGYYQNLKQCTDETAKLGGKNGKVNTLHKSFTYNIREEQIFAESYLFVYRDHFVKIRISQPNLGKDIKNESVIKFLAEIDKLFSK